MTDLLVDARAISKSYGTGPSRTPVLHGVDLQVRHGECLFLVGPSGSGKSTLLSILGCVLRPDAGELEIAGQDVLAFSERQRTRFRRESIGFAFQRFHLFNGLNAWENVSVAFRLLGCKSSKARQYSLALLDRVGLSDRANYQIGQLSMGQKQRVAFARAVAGNPELILADEPTASLDADSGLNAIRILKDLCSELGTTAVVVTHDSRIFPFADRIVRLTDGQIAADHSAAHAGAADSGHRANPDSELTPGLQQLTGALP